MFFEFFKLWVFMFEMVLDVYLLFGRKFLFIGAAFEKVFVFRGKTMKKFSTKKLIVEKLMIVFFVKVFVWKKLVVVVVFLVKVIEVVLKKVIKYAVSASVALS